jgi:RNA polymerase sigma-70 factor (ECF subfamily)
VVESEWIEAAQGGDREALVELLRAVEHDVYKIAYYMFGNEHDAKDGAQEALLRICRSLHTYERKAKFRTWLHRLVTNCCIDLMRKQKESVSLDGTDLHLRATEHVEEQVLRRQMIDDVGKAIAQLDEPFRTMVVLRYVEQYSYEEIADLLAMPLNTVKSYLFRAKVKLQKQLKPYEKGGVFG